MIPKKIHYCWFGGNPIPEHLTRYMESWKKYCPDYEIIRWDESNYDVHKIKYIEQAYEAKKWGFVSDYARLDIIYNEGGIYFDTDVEIIKSFDEMLYNRAFMGFERCMTVSNGLGFGAIPNHPAIKELMEIYESKSFIKNDGSYETTPCPLMQLEKFKEFGCTLNNQLQTVNGITIYPSEYFAPMDYETGKLNLTSNTFSIHHYEASWMSKKQKMARYLKMLMGKDMYGKMIKVKKFFFN